MQSPDRSLDSVPSERQQQGNREMIYFDMRVHSCVVSPSQRSYYCTNPCPAFAVERFLFMSVVVPEFCGRSEFLEAQELDVRYFEFGLLVRRSGRPNLATSAWNSSLESTRQPISFGMKQKSSFLLESRQKSDNRMPLFCHAPLCPSSRHFAPHPRTPSLLSPGLLPLPRPPGGRPTSDLRPVAPDDATGVADSTHTHGQVARGVEVACARPWESGGRKRVALHVRSLCSAGN